MKKYIAIIYFECDDEVNTETALEVATERLENYDKSIKIHDTHVEEDEQ